MIALEPRILENCVRKLSIKTKDNDMLVSLKKKSHVVVPKDQAWFYSSEWQEKEREVDRQTKEGKIQKALNKKELFKKLGLD